MNVDQYVTDIVTKNKNMLIPWYLMLSFLYYHQDMSIVHDAIYDDICKQLKENWDKLYHRHKKYIELESLEAGTGFYISDYPEIVKSAAFRFIKENNIKKL